MKRYFCTECERSVIEAEFEEGTAFRIDDRVYCYDCGLEYMQRKEEEQQEAPAAAENSAESDETAPEPETAEPEQGAPEEETEEPADDEEEQEAEGEETEDLAVDEEEMEEKPVSSASSRRKRAIDKKERSSGSSRRASARISSGRRKAAGSSASSRALAANGRDAGSGRSRSISFSERSVEDKMKIIVLTMSALFIVIGFIGLIVRGCGGPGEKRTIIHKTEAQELVDEARKLKKEGTALYHKGDFDGALAKYYAAQKKYEQVLEKVRNEELTEEDKENNLSYDWIDDEYCSIGPLIRSARDMKVRSDSRRERLRKK